MHEATTGEHLMTYPLEAGGLDDYPVKVGSMLLTMVDPNKGFESAFNRWYERDHYYAGCMVGPWQMSGSRWVAPRSLKDLRWPAGDTAVANPTDSGSYVAIYWVQEGHHEEWTKWGEDTVTWLYSNGRGFPERKHTHTNLFDRIGAANRDADGVPVDVALDSAYDGIFAVWFDARDGHSAKSVHAELLNGAYSDLMTGSNIEIVSSWQPVANPAADQPMDLGTPAGGPERLVQLIFVRGDVTAELDRMKAYTDGVAAAGLADVHLVAPFFRTVVGTDTYADQLW
jgi:hypothetical protein